MSQGYRKCKESGNPCVDFPAGKLEVPGREADFPNCVVVGTPQWLGWRNEDVSKRGSESCGGNVIWVATAVGWDGLPFQNLGTAPFVECVDGG